MICFLRLWQLIKIDWVVNKKNILTTAAAFAVVFALLPFHLISNMTVYFFVLYSVGFVSASRAFTEMHDKEKACHYLTLPCSNLERFLSKWLLSGVFFPIAITLIFFLLSNLNVIANRVLYHNVISVFDITQLSLWIQIGKYIILQSVFLLGAAYFYKNAFAKTTLVIGGCLLILGCIFALSSWMICASCGHSTLFDIILNSLSGLYFTFWVVLAPICWFFTYWLIGHTEIR